MVWIVYYNYVVSLFIIIMLFHISVSGDAVFFPFIILNNDKIASVAIASSGNDDDNDHNNSGNTNNDIIIMIILISFILLSRSILIINKHNRHYNHSDHDKGNRMNSTEYRSQLIR